MALFWNEIKYVHAASLSLESSGKSVQGKLRVVSMNKGGGGGGVRTLFCRSTGPLSSPRVAVFIQANSGADHRFLKVSDLCRWSFLFLCQHSLKMSPRVLFFTLSNSHLAPTVDCHLSFFLFLDQDRWLQKNLSCLDRPLSFFCYFQRRPEGAEEEEEWEAEEAWVASSPAECRS